MLDVGEIEWWFGLLTVETVKTVESVSVSKSKSGGMSVEDGVRDDGYSVDDRGNGLSDDMRV